MKIKKITKLNKKYDRYDLTVSATSNFYANGILIHNTSCRLANQKIVVYPKPVSKLLNKLYMKGYGNYRIINWIEKKFRKTVWSPVAGSRRVIKLRDSNQSGYYDEDIYNKALDEYSSLIPKSWIIYGELIGWVGSKPIQPKYTYGIPCGQFEFYVYRIAIVNDDGLSCDLSHDQMVHWCKDNGFKVCPEMWRGAKKDFDCSKYMDIKYRGSGFNQCVGLSSDSPCDEGVVIRIDGQLTPELYKAKSPVFLGHETKVLDEETISLEDEANE